MPRIAYVILCSCLLVVVGFIAQPASAGGRDHGYRDDGYYVEIPPPPRRPAHVWYSSNCCYMEIVRHVGHERQVRYVKVKPSRIKQALLEQQKALLEQKRERADRRERISRNDRLSHHVEYKVVVVRRNGNDDRESCRHRRVRVLKPGGGWAWALAARCE